MVNKWLFMLSITTLREFVVEMYGIQIHNISTSHIHTLLLKIGASCDEARIISVSELVGFCNEIL